MNSHSRSSCFSKKLDSFFQLIILSLLVFISNSIPSALAQDPGSKPSLVEKFWDIGCEFSGVVTRVRRSASRNPTPEEPNFDDPEELFKYLYPLADVVPGEEEADGGNLGSQRSKQGTHSLSSWLEDLLELWHSECHLRRNKRSSRRMSEFNREESTETRRRFHGMFGKRNRGKSDGEGVRKNSTLGIFSRRKDGISDDTELHGEYKYVMPIPSEGNNETESGYEMDEYNSFRNADKGEGDKEDEKDKVEDKLEAVESLLGVGGGSDGIPTTPVQQPVEAPKEDIFFAQYGGDIEYFFPLLSFGIPFDGEITLLGFHGFRGIFPY